MRFFWWFLIGALSAGLSVGEAAAQAVVPQTVYVCEAAGGTREFNGYVDVFVPKGVYYLGKGPTEAGARSLARQICTQYEGPGGVCDTVGDDCRTTTAALAANIGTVMGVGTPPKPGEYICDQRGLDRTTPVVPALTGEYFTATGTDYDKTRAAVEQKCVGRACMPMRCSLRPQPQSKPQSQGSGSSGASGSSSGGTAGGTTSSGSSGITPGKLISGPTTSQNTADPKVQKICGTYADEILKIDDEYRQKGCPFGLFPPDRAKLVADCSGALFLKRKFDTNPASFRKTVAAACKPKPALLGTPGTFPKTSRDKFCHDYADMAKGVAVDWTNRKCAGRAPTHEDWYAHQSWCHAQSDAAVQKAMANLRKQAGTCRIAGGPPAPKQAPDPSRHPVCSSYSTYVGQWQAKAKAVGCRIETLPERSMSFPIKQHYDWCMTNSDAEFRQRSPQALGFKAWIEKLCSAQLRRPVKL